MPTPLLDVVIVGAGPAGLSAAAQAARRGLTHVVLERGAAIAHTIQKYHRGKLVMDSPTTLRLQPAHPLRFARGSREEVLAAFEADVAATQLRVRLHHEVTAITGEHPALTVHALDWSTGSPGEPPTVTFPCANVVVAMGTQGNIRKLTDRRTKPPAAPPGRDLPHVIYQLDDPAEFQEQPMIVVGAGDSAIENALALANPELRNQVHLVYDKDGFGNARTANQAAIKRAIAEHRVAFHPNSTITRLEERGERCRVVIEGPATLELDAFRVICRLGADPPKGFLADAGVPFKTRDPRERPARSQRFETPKRGIYVVGATGDANLIKTAMNEGFEVIEHIANQAVVPMDVEQIVRQVVAPWQISAASPEAAVEMAVETIRTTVPLFADVSPLQLRSLLFNECVVLRPPATKDLFTAKEFGPDLYVVLEGSVTVGIPGRDGTRAVVHRPGELLGVLSLFEDGYYEGTARADPGCVLLRVPRSRLLQAASGAFSIKGRLDAAFARNALQNLFEPHATAARTPALVQRIADVAERAELRAWSKGDIVFREGAEPDGLYLVRRGSLAITQEAVGRSAFLAFRPAGSVIGEMAVIAPARRRSATAVATVPSETVRIPQADIVALLADFPEIERALRDLETVRLVENGAHLGRSDGDDLLAFLRDAGAGEATNILLIDDALCVRCNNCETACAATHGGVSRLDREAGRTYVGVHVPTTCRHCANALCMSDCPPDVIHREPTGEITIDLEGCIHCGACARNCPYGVIQMQPQPTSFLGRVFPRWFGGPAQEDPVKCDLCEGLGGAACEVSCPTGAIVRTHPSEYLRHLLGDT